MSLIKRRFPLRESEKRRFLESLSERLGPNIRRLIGDKPQIEVVETRENEVFIINGKPLLVRVDGETIPSLMFEDLTSLLPKIIVNMGAVPHICNGADVMAPGIVRIKGEFGEGDYAVVLDEKHGKAIAIVKALVNSEDAKSLRRGKILKNLHYVGDSCWRVIREISERKG